MNPLLEITDLTKSFRRKRVLEGVSLALRPDESVVLLGSNGAGKSTLLRCLLGLERPDSGSVSVLGRDPQRHGDAVRERVGYVPDHPDVYDWMTADELFRFLAPAYPTWSVERAERFAEALRYPRTTPFKAMSRGEASKVVLAAALVPAPPLVVLDESFARLAPDTRDEVLEFFVREAPLDGGAALVATHDLDVAARLADRVFLLEDTHLTEVDDLHETGGVSVPARLRALYDSPNSLPLAG